MVVGVGRAGGHSRHPHSPSPAASGAGSTAGWRSSPGSSSRAGGVRREMKIQCRPSACSSRLHFSKAGLPHAPSAALESLRSPKYRLHSRVARWGSASRG